ncbi:Y+L amino acid transporter 1 [Trichinella nelsoni]|uniref:Y+L amino acid transporter 1 n=1 Tax=Trichinella nelsoni TaxID=6336 RepID=A0A0V0S2H1_9BILA|nr:Y+L amino acid transporter 1 [Trichinella nelsoni]
MQKPNNMTSNVFLKVTLKLSNILRKSLKMNDLSADKKRNNLKSDDDDDGDGKIKLQRSVSLLNGITIIIGCIIGSGIFVSPKGVHEHSGSVGLSMIIWIFGGLFAALGAYCYAELGTLIRKSGGDYAYITEAFGPFVGFIRLWIEAIVIRPCSATITALTFAKYALVPLFGDCQQIYAEPMLACCLLLIITLINCYSVRWATFIQDILTYAKIIALVLIIVTGSVMAFLTSSGSFDNIFDETSTDAGEISLALYSGLFAYNGWNYLNFIVEELKNPKRNLPLAIAISCSLVTVIYCLTNLAFYAVISPKEFLEADATAMTFANKVYGSFAWIMPIFVAFATVGSCNGVILTASRLFFVGGREGQMPQALTLISLKYMTPVPAVILTGLLSCVFLLLSSNIYSLINYIQIVNWLAISLAMLSLFQLRRKMPDAPRTIKVNLIFPFVFLVGCLFLVVVPVVAAPIDTIIGLGITFTSVPIYFLFIKHRPEVLSNFSSSVSMFTQKFFLAVPEEGEEELQMTTTKNSKSLRHRPDSQLAIVSDSKLKDPADTEIHLNEDQCKKGEKGKNKTDIHDSGELKLERSITLLNGVNIIIGVIIGSGIFISPKGVHEKAGSVGLSLILWVCGGIFAALGSYCYSELGTLISDSGGDYAYIRKAYGPMIAFIRLWVEVIIISTVNVDKFTERSMVYSNSRCHNICKTFSTCVSHNYRRSYAFYKKFVANSGSFDDAFSGTSMNAGDISLALYSALFAYNGWNYLNFIVEEIQNPKRNLPLAIAISCTTVTVIYTLTNVAFYAVIPPHEFLATDATATTFAEKVYGPAAWIMPVFVALSTIGSCNGTILTTSRLYFVGAREGHMPETMTLISMKHRTPFPATIITGILSCLFLLLSQNIFTLINCVQVVNWLAIAVATLCVFHFRRTMPNAPRVIKVNLIFPILFFAGCIFLVVVPIIAEPTDTEKTTVSMQKLLMAIPEIS